MLADTVLGASQLLSHPLQGLKALMTDNEGKWGEGWKRGVKIKASESTCCSALVHPSHAMRCEKQVMHRILHSWGQVDAQTAEAMYSQAETSNPRRPISKWDPAAGVHFSQFGLNFLAVK